MRAALLRVLLPLLGIAVAVYALYIEHRKAEAAVSGEQYEAMCDIEGLGKCSDVLTSEWGHILSKWGLVAKGSALDLPNPVLGIAFYGLVLLWPLQQRAPVLLASAGSLLFSLYLAGVLYFVLKDFCAVCVTSYLVNAAIFAVEYLAAPAEAQPAAAKKAAGKKVKA